MVMRIVCVLLALLAVLAGGGPAGAQTGRQLIITMRLAAPAKPSGGAYYIAFAVDDSILNGPESDSTNWTHYILYRGGRFFFGQVPSTPFRPFEFVAIRPPQPFLYGEILGGGRTLRVRVALTDLLTTSTSAARVKINFVTVDDHLKPLDALGQGTGDRFAFVTVDLRRDTFVPVSDRAGDAADPAFDITGGDIQVGIP
jgi:hypothetical protein